MKAARVLKAQAGFSLIELMIVVAIIGILATVAIPNFQRFQAKAKQSESKSSLAGIYTAQKSFFSEWSMYMSDLSAAGYKPEGRLIYLAGFSAHTAQTPAAYTGPAIVATNFNTAGAQGLCQLQGVAANAAKPCTNEALTLADASLTAFGGGAATVTAGTGVTAAFTAAAEGKLLSATVIDRWTIDNNKLLLNGTSGL